MCPGLQKKKWQWPETTNGSVSLSVCLSCSVLCYVIRRMPGCMASSFCYDSWVGLLFFNWPTLKQSIPRIWIFLFESKGGVSFHIDLIKYSSTLLIFAILHYYFCIDQKNNVISWQQWSRHWYGSTYVWLCWKSSCFPKPITLCWKGDQETHCKKIHPQETIPEEESSRVIALKFKWFQN